MAAVPLLASKLTLGKYLTVYAYHSTTGLLSFKGSLWLPDNQLLKYQVLLLDRPAIQIKLCASLNPATFLPEKEGIEA